MNDRPQNLQLTKLYRKTSKSGSTYFVGRLGGVRLALLKSKDVADDGGEIWNLVVSEAPQRDDHAKRDWQRPGEPTTRCQRRQHYRVLHDDEVLIASTRIPEFDSCRALQARGLTGLLEIWRNGATAPCLRLDIETGAQWTIEENSSRGPKLAHWKSRPIGAERSSVSCAARGSQTAISCSSVPQRPETKRPTPAQLHAILRLLEQHE
jgi:hypothetical protein